MLWGDQAPQYLFHGLYIDHLACIHTFFSYSYAHNSKGHVSKKVIIKKNGGGGAYKWT